MENSPVPTSFPGFRPLGLTPGFDPLGLTPGFDPRV